MFESLARAEQARHGGVDLAEVDDTYSYRELMHLEALRLARPGDAGPMLEEGFFGRDGELPVNVSGGSLGQGYLFEANGLARTLECVLQLRGEAGKRQIASVARGRKLALTHNLGGAPGECVSFVSVVGSARSV